MLVTIMDTIGSTALGSTGRGMVGAGPESPCSVRGMSPKGSCVVQIPCLELPSPQWSKEPGGGQEVKGEVQGAGASGARSANVTAFPSAEMFVKMSIFYVAASSCTAHVFVLTIPVTPEIPAWMRYAG